MGFRFIADRYWLSKLALKLLSKARQSENNMSNPTYRMIDGYYSGMHVREYDGHYKIHRDKKDPQRDPLGHLYHDAPHWLAAIAAIAAGAAIGIGYSLYSHYKKKNKKK